MLKWRYSPWKNNGPPPAAASPLYTCAAKAFAMAPVVRIAVGSIRNSRRSLSVSDAIPVVVFVGDLNTACASPPTCRE
jgi:hypothetical protein